MNSCSYVDITTEIAVCQQLFEKNRDKWLKIWYNFHSKSKGEHTVNQDTVTISRAEYEELRKANDELRQANEDLSKQVSFLMQQITKCRTRIRKWTICTSDKLKGQLVRLSFMHNVQDLHGRGSTG